MTGIPLSWQILIAAGVITGLTVVLAALSRAGRRDDTRGQRR